MRKSLCPTALEIDEAPVGCSKFLIVGVAIPSFKLSQFQVDINLAGSRKQETVGRNEPQAKQLLEINRDSLMLVVSPIKSNQAKVSLGALLNPNENGISTPYIIPQKEVFFFDEYRDDSTSHPTRTYEWTTIVAEHACLDTTRDDRKRLLAGYKLQQ